MNPRPAIIIALLTLASEVRADENVACTLNKPIKVQISGKGFVTIDAGTKITVKTRSAASASVTTPQGVGNTATKTLESSCKLPPRPPEDDTPVKPEKPAKPVPEPKIKPEVKAKPIKPPPPPKKPAKPAKAPKTKPTPEKPTIVLEPVPFDEPSPTVAVTPEPVAPVTPPVRTTTTPPPQPTVEPVTTTVPVVEPVVTPVVTPVVVEPTPTPTPPSVVAPAPASEAGLPPWATLGVAGVSATALVVTGVSGAINLAVWQQAKELQTSEVVDGKALVSQQRAVQNTFIATVVAAGVAVTAGIGAGVMAAFTEWPE